MIFHNNDTIKLKDKKDKAKVNYKTPDTAILTNITK